MFTLRNECTNARDTRYIAGLPPHAPGSSTAADHALAWQLQQEEEAQANRHNAGGGRGRGGRGGGRGHPAPQGRGPGGVGADGRGRGGRGNAPHDPHRDGKKKDTCSLQ